MSLNKVLLTKILKGISLVILATLVLPSQAQQAQEPLLAHWSFEQVKQPEGNLAASTLGQSLTSENGASGIRTFVVDNSGNQNVLHQLNANSTGSVFSENVPFPTISEKPNTRSLLLKRGEFGVSQECPLAYNDLRKSWRIQANLMLNLLGTEQVFICKEGEKGQIGGDVSIGFDNMEQRFFVEVMTDNGETQRLFADEKVKAALWYTLKAEAHYNQKTNTTTLKMDAKPAQQHDFESSNELKFSGAALRRDAGMWIIGRGFPGGYPNSLQVLDGAIDEVQIWGHGLPKEKGQNPLFPDAFTADPAALVVGDTLYLYAGQDAAQPGGWFNMPHWLCYSTTDMKNWESHGPVLASDDFANAKKGAAWAAQVIEKDGKYFFYATLDDKKGTGHIITVAVSDSPTGPFKEVMEGKPLVTDRMTTDSHRANSDIDPTVFIDDDGTSWMAWGNGDCYMVKLKDNMAERDGKIKKVPYRNFSEGPWIFKRKELYYNIYAADAPGVQPEQIAYSTAENISGPWTYQGLLTGPAKLGFTIHPSVVEFKNQWYFFYHDGSYPRNGEPGGFSRRSVCVEYLYFNPDGTIKPIELTTTGISSPSKNLE